MTTTETKTRPIIFSGPMVRAILDGRKTMTRRIVSWKNSTVLGYPAKLYWPHLRFDEAIPRDDSLLLMALTGKHEKNRDVHLSVPFAAEGEENEPSDDLGWYRVRPVWNVGDHFWVREVWCPRSGGALALDRICKPRYRATEELNPAWGFKWRSPIHMPRWASRITLEITGVRVERLQDISGADVVAEGWPNATHRVGCCNSDPPCHLDHVTAGDLVCAGVGDEDGAIEWFADLWDSLNAKRAPWSSSPWVWVIAFKRVEGSKV